MSQTIDPIDQDTVERDATVDETETPARDAPAREADAPRRRTRRGLSWLAVGAALVASVGFAVFVLNSRGDSSDRPAVTPAAVNGSDQHLHIQAAEIAARNAAREAAQAEQDRYVDSLESQAPPNQAAEIAARSDVMGSDQHLYIQAAEIAARNAAREAAQAEQDRSSDATGSD